MKTIRRIKLLVVLSCCLAFGAQALEPAWEGPLGNPEEPALRPYKWFWRGAKALVYYPFRAAVDGHVKKTPVLGLADGFRGLRHGLVEAGASVQMGMIGAVPRPMKVEGKVNTFINEDLLLRNLADTAATAYALGVLRGSGPFDTEFFSEDPAIEGEAVQGTLAVVASQQISDQKPIERINARAEKVNESLRTKKLPEASAVHKAQKKYVGSRVPVDTEIDEKGNLLKLARR